MLENNNLSYTDIEYHDNINIETSLTLKQDHSSMTILINIVYYFLINRHNNFLTCAKTEI